MKQRAFAWMLALILALTPILAIADGEQTEPPATQAPVEPTEQPTAAPTAEPTQEPTQAPTQEPRAEPTQTPGEPTQAPGEPTDTPQAGAEPFKIDTYWVYPGMEKSYAAGYVPTVTDKAAQIVMPLLGKAQDGVIRVVPEFPPDGPFEPGNVQFDVREQVYDVRHSTDKTGRMKAYLINFSVPLKAQRTNGNYTVSFRVTYKTLSGELTEQSFSIQVPIKNGKNPSSGGGGGGGPTAVKKPVLLIEDGSVTPTETAGSATVSLKVSIGNVGQIDACNVRIVATAQDGDLVLNSDLNGVFLDALAVNGEAEATFEFRVTRHALEGEHRMQVDVSYEDKYGNTYSEAGQYRVRVAQPVEIAYDPVKLPESLTSGDTFTQLIYVYNPSCATAYNVRAQLNVDGLICSSAYLGNIPPQGEASKELSVFVTTLSGSQKYGDTWGSFQIDYESEDGERQTLFSDLKSVIAEPVKITDEEKVKQEQEQKEQQTLSQWWISLLVAIAVIIILIAVILIARFARMMRMK